MTTPKDFPKPLHASACPRGLLGLVVAMASIFSSSPCDAGSAGQKTTQKAPYSAKPSKRGSAPAPLSMKRSQNRKFIQAFEKKWETTRSFQAGFHQTIEHLQMGGSTKSTGRVSVEKPDKLKWEETTDFQKTTQILNASKLTQMQQSKRQGRKRTIDIYPSGAKTLSENSLGFLSGRLKLGQAFRVHVLPPKDGARESETAELEMRPKDGGDAIVAVVDRKSYLLRALRSESVESRVTIAFENFKVGAKFPKGFFEFDPKSADKKNDRVIVHK